MVNKNKYCYEYFCTYCDKNWMKYGLRLTTVLTNQLRVLITFEFQQTFGDTFKVIDNSRSKLIVN